MKILKSSSLLVFVLLLAGGSLGSDAPPLTSRFFGSVSLDGGPTVPAGTQISASVDGVTLETA